MKNTTDNLWQGLRRIEQLIEAPDLDAALKVLRQVEAQVAAAGIDSPHLAWLRAIVEDNRGDYEAALGSVQRAIALDPVAPPFRHSFKVIVSHIRESLGVDRKPSALPVPKLWALLVRAGEADDGVHLALVRHHIEHKELADAARVLQALTTLSPANTEAWALMLDVALRLDDVETVTVARLRVATDGVEGIPFVIQRPANG
jgi:hypothetical protein